MLAFSRNKISFEVAKHLLFCILYVLSPACLEWVPLAGWEVGPPGKERQDLLRVNLQGGGCWGVCVCLRPRASLVHCGLAPGAVPDATEISSDSDRTVELSVLPSWHTRRNSGSRSPTPARKSRSRGSDRRLAPTAAAALDPWREGCRPAQLQTAPAGPAIAVCRDRPPALGQRRGGPSNLSLPARGPPQRSLPSIRAKRWLSLHEHPREHQQLQFTGRFLSSLFSWTEVIDWPFARDGPRWFLAGG